jgi:hypothetical protein
VLALEEKCQMYLHKTIIENVKCLLIIPFLYHSIPLVYFMMITKSMVSIHDGNNIIMYYRIHIILKYVGDKIQSGDG